MVQLRCFTLEDCEAVVAIRNHCESEPVTAAQYRQWIEIEESETAHGSVWLRLVAVDEAGAVLGHGAIARNPEMPAGLFQVRVIVAPDHRGKGVGGLLYQRLEHEASDRGATRLAARANGTDEEAFAWATRRGFYMDRQRTESVLDLSRWDGSPFAGVVDALRTRGFTLTTVSGQLPEPLRRGLYEVEAATGPDVPNWEGEMMPYDRWVQGYTQYDLPQVTALALDGERVVGASVTYLPTAPGAGAETDYTGVLREYRGKGIALALKLLTIDATVAAGAPHMRTWNDPDNPAMLAVNVKLGYQFIPGPRRLKKDLV